MAGKYGFERNGVKFGFENEDLYHYEAFKYGNISRAELTKEYSRLRQTANKRLQRMQGTKYEQTQTYLRNAGKYKTLAQIKKEAKQHTKNMGAEAAQKYVDRVVALKLADLYKFLTAKTGSIRRMQRVENEVISSLRSRGLTFINKNNIQQFGDYMEYMRTLHQNKIYDSERAAELFGTAVRKGIDPMQIAADFAYWKAHQEELEKTPKIKNAKKRTAEEYKKRIERK